MPPRRAIQLRLRNEVLRKAVHAALRPYQQQPAASKIASWPVER